jgi:hypothetical protein
MNQQHVTTNEGMLYKDIDAPVNTVLAAVEWRWNWGTKRSLPRAYLHSVSEQVLGWRKLMLDSDTDVYHLEETQNMIRSLHSRCLYLGSLLKRVRYWDYRKAPFLYNFAKHFILLTFSCPVLRNFTDTEVCTSIFFAHLFAHAPTLLSLEPRGFCFTCEEGKPQNIEQWSCRAVALMLSVARSRHQSWLICVIEYPNACWQCYTWLSRKVAELIVISFNTDLVGFVSCYLEFYKIFERDHECVTLWWTSAHIKPATTVNTWVFYI